MLKPKQLPLAALVGLACSLPAQSAAQVTTADYERAAGLREKYEAAALNVPGPATWVGKSHRFWYRRSVKGGNEFVLVDAETGRKQPPFDHEKLAATLATMTGRKITAVTLPFNTFTFKDDGRAIDARFDGATWTCTLADYACTKAPSVGAFEQRQPPPACTPPGPDAKPRVSPDGKWEAVVTNYNVAVRETGAKALAMLSTDGSEGNCYELATIAWAPDSKKLAAYRVKPGYRRLVHYVESSPEDQLQPKHSTRVYAKPGDVLDLEQPVILAVDAKTALPIDNALFPNPYDLSRLEWRKDSSAVTFEYNQRGHQVFRVIEADAATGAARAVVAEEPRTFFTYSSKKFR
ncbi:MAG: DPP IV N-terminal domain-containing protein, partial [Rhodospirillaceae bacterium]